MKVSDLISALRTLVHDCPQYANVPVLMEICRPDGSHEFYPFGFHVSDGIGDEEEPERLLLTVNPNDYEDMDDRFVNESPTARMKGSSFTPNVALYGREIYIYSASNEPADNSHIVGTLKEITGPHTYVITVGSEDQHWEVDSVNDLEVPDNADDPLALWSAWR
jgi:hypothetical protein